METKLLRELCVEIVDCPHSTPSWTSAGKIVIRNFNIQNGKIDFSNPSFTDQEHYLHRIKRAKPEGGDLVITREAPMGQVGMIPSNVECCLGQRMVLLKVDRTVCNPYYLLYALQSPAVQFQIKCNEGTGTTVSNLRIPILEHLEIPFVNKENQDRIAAFLKLIDDKIEVNNKIIKSLEEFSIALVKNSLKESINNGLSLSLSDYALLNPTRTIKKGKISRYIGMSSLSNSVSFPLDWEFKEFSGGAKFQNGDTLFARITPCLENGKTAFVGFLKEDEVAFGSTEYIVICSKGVLPNEFFYCLARTPDFRDFAAKRFNGTSGRQRISHNEIAPYPLPFFSTEKIENLNNVLPPIFKQINNLGLQNRRLNALRNIILPKLISGEIELKKQ